MEWVKEFLQTEYVIFGFEKGITLGQSLGSILSLLLGFTLGKISSYIIGNKFKKLAEKTKSKADDFLAESAGKPVALFFQVTGIYLALQWIGLPKKPSNFEEIAQTCYHIFLALDVTWFIVKFVDAFQLHLTAKAEEQKEKDQGGLDVQVVRLIARSLRTFIWLLSGVLILQNLGYSISGLLAGLGLGGLAVAMAAKDTLANLFGSLTVFLDRPFRIGDLITLENQTGTVEEIGFRSTRIRTFEDTLITIPNQNLTNASVENVSVRRWRRVNIVIGLTYNTTLLQMKKVVAGIKGILEKHPKVKKDYLVAFSAFADSSLNITVIYRNLTTSLDEHLQIQEEINLQMMECVENEGAEFAFPSRTVYLKGEEKNLSSPEILSSSLEEEKPLSLEENRPGKEEEKTSPVSLPTEEKEKTSTPEKSAPVAEEKKEEKKLSSPPPQKKERGGKRGKRR